MFMKTTGTPDAWETLSHAFALARLSSKSLGREATLSEALGRKMMEWKQLELGTGSDSCILLSHGYETYPSWSLVIANAFTILDVLEAAMQFGYIIYERKRVDNNKIRRVWSSKASVSESKRKGKARKWSKGFRLCSKLQHRKFLKSFCNVKKLHAIRQFPTISRDVERQFNFWIHKAPIH